MPEDKPLKESAEAVMARRERVMQMKLESGLHNHEIADVLGVSRATVERDISWARATWRRRFKAGAGAKFDAPASIGNMHERLDRIYSLSMRLFTAGNGVYGLDHPEPSLRGKVRPMSVHERAYALRTATAATVAQKNLLMDAGLIDRAIGSMEVEVRQRFSAREIGALARQLQQLRERGGEPEPEEFVVDDDVLMPEGERRFLIGGNGNGGSDDDGRD